MLTRCSYGSAAAWTPLIVCHTPATASLHPFPAANGLGAYETQECDEAGDADPQLRLGEIFPALALRIVFRDLGHSPVLPKAFRLHLHHVPKFRANYASSEGSSAPN